MEIRVLLGLSANKEAYWSTFVFLSSNRVSGAVMSQKIDFACNFQSKMKNT